MIYDDYGRPQDDPRFGSKSEVPEPYLVDTAAANVTYLCFSDAAERCIRRITRSGSLTTAEFAIGPWEERASLTYLPVNTTGTVEAAAV